MRLGIGLRKRRRGGCNVNKVEGRNVTGDGIVHIWVATGYFQTGNDKSRL